MVFQFSNFILQVEQKVIQLNTQIIAPQKIERSKPADYRLEHKTKEITIFTGLYYKNTGAINNLFLLIEFVELLKAFSGNKLEIAEEYTIQNVTAKIAEKNGKYSLSIKIKDEAIFYLSKFKCATLASQLNKIVQKVEAWQE